MSLTKVINMNMDIKVILRQFVVQKLMKFTQALEKMHI